MPRFSDQKLQEFYMEFDTHRREQEQFNSDLLESIKDNTATVASLAEKTESIIEVWVASQGALKVVRWVGSIVKWTAGVIITIGGVWYYFKAGPKP